MSKKVSQLTIRTLRTTIFDPSVGLWRDGVLLPQSFMVAQNGKRLARLQSQGQIRQPTKARHFQGGPVCYLGVVNSCWGHCLLDCTRFLWPIVKGLIPSDMRFVYSLARDPGRPEQTDIVPNFRRLLECLGISSDRLIRIAEPTLFDEILLPDECFSYNDESPAGHTFSPEGSDLFDFIAERAAPGTVAPYRTVYLSRSNWTHNATEFGERRIEEVIREKTGCEIVHPEKLTFREMVKLLRETKKLFATEGSLAHNAVFLPKCAELVLLMKAKMKNTYQPMVNAMRELKVTYVDINTSDRFYRDDQKWVGPFFLHVTPALAEYLQCEPEWPRWTRLRYLLNVWLRRLYLSIRI